MNKFYLQKWRYMQQVGSWLPGSRKMKKIVLREIESNIQIFLQERPTVSFDDICARFGAPQQIAATYVGEMEVPELLNDLRIQKRVMQMTCAVCIFVAVTWMSVVGMALQNHRASDDGYYVTEIVEVD